MSLLPYVVDRYLQPSRDWFGFGLHPRESLLAPTGGSLFRSLADWERLGLQTLNEIDKQSHIGKDGFQVCMDVQHFAPNEISVKTVDNSIVVEAKHEERKDEHGYISRQFCRRYDLPDGFKGEDVVSTISSDGILTVKAPPVTPAIEGSNVRQVEIQQTGPARLSVTKNEENKENVENGNK